MTGYFITGTDTGVGKTFVTAALARRARHNDPTSRVFAFKPVETGCTGTYGEDQELLAHAAGDWQRGALRGLYQFRMPAAPLVAAQAESRTIDIDLIARTFEQGRSAAGAPMLTDAMLAIDGTSDQVVCLVEGAGGWRVPLTTTLDMAGLANRLSLPIIVVARAGLGTINHSLLTLEAVERDGCTIAALVLSQRPEDDRALAVSNAIEISRRWPGPLMILGDESALDPLLGFLRAQV